MDWLSYLEMAFQFDTFTGKNQSFFEFFSECVYDYVKRKPNRLKGRRRNILKSKYLAVDGKTIGKKQHKLIVKEL